MFQSEKSRWAIPYAVLAAGLTLALPVSALAAPPSGRVKIANANSNLCLSPAGGSGSLNANIVQFTCDTHPARAFSFTVVSENMVEITNLNSGLCITVAGGSRNPNVNSVQYTCDEHPSRRFVFDEIGGGKFRLRNVNSGLCLTIAGGSTGLNAIAVQYPCDGHLSRDWSIVP